MTRQEKWQDITCPYCGRNIDNGQAWHLHVTSCPHEPERKKQAYAMLNEDGMIMSLYRYEQTRIRFALDNLPSATSLIKHYGNGENWVAVAEYLGLKPFMSDYKRRLIQRRKTLKQEAVPRLVEPELPRQDVHGTLYGWRYVVEWSDNQRPVFVLRWMPLST